MYGERLLKKYWDLLKNFIFPKRCPVCDEVVAFGEGYVHSECKAKLKYISEPVCMKCGKPILDISDDVCSDCGRRRHQFDAGRAVWIYEQQMRKSIAAFKYKGRQEYAGFYTEQILAVHSDWLKALHVDVVLPIPLNSKKFRSRGYNQAGLLAKGIAGVLKIPVDTKYLQRTSWTEPQKSLSPVQRYQNLKQAFCVQGQAGKYHSVLLVDDIYTTGSTMDACAAVLKAAGVRYVYFVSLCIGSDREG